jgi:hypothetical protein
LHGDATESLARAAHHYDMWVCLPNGYEEGSAATVRDKYRK